MEEREIDSVITFICENRDGGAVILRVTLDQESSWFDVVPHFNRFLSAMGYITKHNEFVVPNDCTN